ncbi:hypothetical protein [Halalkalibacter urbisdiaboli]|uniref:hypothetical protein n=1 Tax=Halalkalibacter urbisdiaboli TaxID=1960589 RepID=UPI000B44E9CC|nr:hypothetical protein [Halalkalibacter urbisdiaboli]
MNKEEFKVQNYYLVEIENTDERYDKSRWSWDIFIAANENQEYRGKALAPGKGIEIDWTPLVGNDLLAEMMGLCESQMPSVHNHG